MATFRYLDGRIEEHRVGYPPPEQWEMYDDSDEAHARISAALDSRCPGEDAASVSVSVLRFRAVELHDQSQPYNPCTAIIEYWQVPDDWRYGDPVVWPVP